MKTIILCGGSGTRLWPISRDLMPKQFCPLFGKESLFAKTVLRNQAVSNELIVVVNQEQVFYAQDQIKSLDVKIPTNYILEPMGRNTAPAIALAALANDPEEILLIVPSDHLIENIDHYQEKIHEARELAQKNNIVTFGIRPSYAETGYGYIQYKQNDVVSFKEKPNLEKAQGFLKSGDFLWNSGMFCFKAGVFLEELKKYHPEIFQQATTAFEHSSDFPLKRIPREEMQKIPSDSIDYAVMEKTKLAKVVPTDLNWSDIGSYDSLSAYAESDEHYSIDSKNNFVKTNGEFVALVGVHDLVVVNSGDALLVMKKGNGQEVRKIYEHLKQNKNDLHKVHLQAYRPWGSYTVLQEEKSFKAKKIEVLPGQRLSLQKHFHRCEHWIVAQGVATVTVGEKTQDYLPNQYIFIEKEEVHRLENKGDIPVIILEIQTGTYLGEDDIVRIQDDYQRA